MSVLGKTTKRVLLLTPCILCVTNVTEEPDIMKIPDGFQSWDTAIDAVIEERQVDGPDICSPATWEVFLLMAFKLMPEICM